MDQTVLASWKNVGTEIDLVARRVDHPHRRQSRRVKTARRDGRNPVYAGDCGEYVLPPFRSPFPSSRFRLISGARISEAKGTRASASTSSMVETRWTVISSRS